MAPKIGRDIARSMFVEGMSVSDIATTHGVTEAAIYYHKNQDLKEGIDWESLRLTKSRDTKNIDLKETEFLNTLMASFEKDLKKLEEIESPQERLNILSDYVKTYYRLKAPVKTDCKTQVSESITQTITTIANLAVTLKSNEVVNFLSEHSDRIIGEVFKNVKK